ncbi:DUF4235 domain-containing protein [Actinomyces gerencseriae]|uniref:DUF4235 domain-containing protein n=1 Tax=Actinomyces gerencseriae TaxID=52769 RepID=UPI00041B8BD9|nr:DUF4235 domain-containing protein [Actinomyces gerencseriae]
MTDSKQNDLTWTAASALILLASGIVAERVVAVGWKAVTGRPAPQDESQTLNYQLGEVVVFAIVSGAVMSLTRQLTLRQAARWRDRRGPNRLTRGRSGSLEA